MQKFISKKQLASELNRSVVTINRWIREGLIPEPLKVSERRTLGWKPEQIQDWLDSTTPTSN